MAASALELRPRGPMALLDATVRLCGTSAGLWSLALPGGALVTGALLSWAEAIRGGRPLFWPSLLLAGAWFIRGVFQGAACHHVERVVLGPGEPSARESLAAAARRAPSLFICVALVLGINVVSIPLTLGLAFFFFSSHVVTYAVTLQGRGHPLALYQTCSRLLGPARGATVWVRLGGLLIQVLVILNLHIAANAGIYLARTLLALDLTYAERYASHDNGAWVLAICALGFTLMEPLRAAAAALLLIDGRVRQEGLDLLAALEQLPRRRPAPRYAALAGAVLLGLAATPARAQGDAPAPATSEISQRLEQVVALCELDEASLREHLDAAAALDAREHPALSRFLAEVEHLAYDDEDCERAALRLESGLELVAAARAAYEAEPGSARAAAKRAEEILARPEFARAPAPAAAETPAVGEETAPDPNSLWSRFKAWLRRWLERLFRTEPRRMPSWSGVGDSGATAANVLVLLLVTAVIVVLGVLLWKARPRRTTSAGIPDSISLADAEAPGTESALSRPPEGWASIADQLAAQGRFREAIRSLYLALLSRLHRDGSIDYHPAHSNWDYLRRFRGPPAWLSPFRELTRRFDVAYYGNAAVGPTGYHAFRELSGPLLSSAATPPSAPPREAPRA